MRALSTLLISFVIAVLTCNSANAEVPTLVTQFISTSSDSSTLKETVQGCTATSINYASIGNTIANLYSDGSFELGYGNSDNDLTDEGDIVILTGIWSSIDAAGTKFRFQPDGNLALGNIVDGYGTLGWLKIYNWTKGKGCVAQSNNNQYSLTYPATFRVVKSDMTLKTSNNSGTLRFTLEGHGQTTANLATPSKTLPIMRYDMQVKGFWY